MAEMLHLLLDWEYPHWMMMAGAILVAAGFIGLAFHRNRKRKPLATSAMVRHASRSAEFCLALRRSRCARRHMASLGGLRYSADDNGACGRRRAEHQNEAGGQRFSESGLWRSVSTSWPWASSLSLPAACPLDGPSSGKVQCVLP